MTRYEYFRETIVDYDLIDRLTELGQMGMRLHTVLGRTVVLTDDGQSAPRGWDVLLERTVALENLND